MPSMPTPGSFAVRDTILYRALRLAQVTTGAGRTASPEQFEDALQSLNALFDGLGIHPDAIYGLSSATYTLVAGQQTYTIGIDPTGATTADFAGSAPVRIERANYVLAGSPATYTPIDVVGVDDWDSLGVRGVSSTIPTALYCDYDAPLAHINFWPVPASANDCELWSWQTQAQLETPDDEIFVPPGYLDMYVYQLAVRMADQFGKVISPNVQSTANKLLGRVKAFNSPSPPIGSADAGTGAGAGGYFNWQTGGRA